jgi:hypothetical protein
MKYNLNKSGMPSNLEDSAAISDFLAKNEGKRVVVVQGLGFVVN